MASARNAFAVATTWESNGLPAKGCSTFGRSDFMRLPWPAARMTMDKGMRQCRSGFSPTTIDLLFELAQLLDRLDLRSGLCQLRLQFGRVHGVAAVPQRLFSALFRCQRR